MSEIQPVQHVGLMMARLEPDVLQESLDHHAMHFHQIVAIAGDDASAEVLAAHPRVICLFRDEELLDAYGARAAAGGPPRFCDACRQPALDWIRREFGVDRTWITLLHADEFWWDSPRRAAEEADANGATYILWGEYRFFLHTTDRGRLDMTLPVVDRLTWCCGPWFEIRQFRLREHQAYIPGRDHQVLPVGLPGRRWRVIPRYRHYPYRSEAQAESAYIDKVASRYWQPDHAWMADRPDPFVDRLPEPANSPLAAWDNVFQCKRDLPEPSAFLPDWWTG